MTRTLWVFWGPIFTALGVGILGGIGGICYVLYEDDKCPDMSCKDCDCEGEKRPDKSEEICAFTCAQLGICIIPLVLIWFYIDALSKYSDLETSGEQCCSVLYQNSTSYTALECSKVNDTGIFDEKKVIEYHNVSEMF